MDARKLDKRTSVTDRPIVVNADDTLSNCRYAEALRDFIANSDTPITLGLQGEWGSGKTSLMNLLKEQLDAMDVATAWVNTWEHGMFRASQEVTPSVLRGLLENLEASCKGRDKRFWPQHLSEKLRSTVDVFKQVGKFAVDAASKKVTGVTASSYVEGSKEQRGIAEIAEIKHDIEDIIDRLVVDPKNPYERVVFFIDDLDRIDPAIAVEVLEALKNIFDVNHCVFILAIDYDVVVKGLEQKFGPKTPENEREFRSFFDKIIQVPFSLPVSSYRIEALLANHFDNTGFAPTEELVEHFAKIAVLTVGTIPRSIKRLVNLFSLLRRIENIGEPRSAEAEGMTKGLKDFCLFALLAVQLAYPRLYRLLTKEPYFDEWDENFAARNNIELLDFADVRSDELLDEPWEQVLFSFCEKDPYLRTRRAQALRAMNALRDALGERLGEQIADALEIASISAVETSEEREPSAGRGNRVNPQDFFTEGAVAKNDVFLFVDIHGNVHEDCHTSLLERRGRSGALMLRMDAVADALEVPIGSHSGKKFTFAFEALPIELTTKAAAVSLHKFFHALSDEEIAKNYNNFGEQNFVRKSDGCSLYEIKQQMKNKS